MLITEPVFLEFSWNQRIQIYEIVAASFSSSFTFYSTSERAQASYRFRLPILFSYHQTSNSSNYSAKLTVMAGLSLDFDMKPLMSL
jgi:hypothetical protein